jgi:hypothetical protein
MECFVSRYSTGQEMDPSYNGRWYRLTALWRSHRFAQVCSATQKYLHTRHKSSVMDITQGSIPKPMLEEIYKGPQVYLQ